MAPSAKNRQPWHYIVFGGTPKTEFLNCMEQGITRECEDTPTFPNYQHAIPDARHTLEVMRQAPIIIAVLNTNGTTPFEPLDFENRIMEINDTLSIGASIQNILLKAEQLGIGTLWIGNTCFAYRELTAYLKTTNQLIGAIALGYPQEKPAPRPRKNLQDIMEYRL